MCRTVCRSQPQPPTVAPPLRNHSAVASSALSLCVCELSCLVFSDDACDACDLHIVLLELCLTFVFACLCVALEEEGAG